MQNTIFIHSTTNHHITLHLSNRLCLTSYHTLIYMTLSPNNKTI
ncbi:hypothetical protein MtrunA17_Chr8g0374381 [Medicago truncatula]|uniref:Uncharacterized protein n=1 Tax=Medicago truncatula TaxID=3880 RepID=A0A396GP76_MEDTR|nr:hypothetical protein MtrunA17_Chr8g0374381 [Medicago truncatula]